MKITRIETVRVDEFPNLTYVVVHTDDGIAGLGETFYGAEAVEAHIHSIIAPALIGKDPLQLERHAASLAGYVGYAGSGAETRARSAIDLALWDVLGKACGQPVYNLIGGLTRESIQIYNTCAGSGYVNKTAGQAVSNWGVKEGLYEDLDAAINRPADLAADLLSSGIRGMKIWPFDLFAEQSGGTYISPGDLSIALRPLEQIRAKVGREMEIMVELHALWDVPTARTILAALEPFEPFWVEDPVRSDIRGGLAAVANHTPLRVAAGESLAGLGAFEGLLEAGALGVVTVDLTWSGGLTAARKVAAAAEARGIPIAPHDCTGPVALAACVHLAASAPNVLLQETVRAGYLGWYQSLVEGGPTISHGFIRPSQTPGLGIRLRDDLRARATTSVRITEHGAGD